MKEAEFHNITKVGAPVESKNPSPEIRKHSEKNREWDDSGEVS